MKKGLVFVCFWPITIPILASIIACSTEPLIESDSHLKPVEPFQTVDGYRDEKQTTNVQPVNSDINVQTLRYLKRIWHHARNTLKNKAGAKERLFEATEKYNEIFEDEINKSGCFWQAYYGLPEKQATHLKRCDFDKLAFDFLIQDPERLLDYSDLTVRFLDSSSAEMTIEKYFPDATNCGEIDLDTIEQPLSAERNDRKWNCIDDDNGPILRPEGQNYTQDSIHDYQEIYKVFHMLMDGYDDKNRLSHTGAALWTASGITSGMKVADVGCGPGLFTFEMANRVGNEGFVYAIDINQSVLDFISYKQTKLAVENIKPVKTHPRSIKLEGSGLDRIFLSQTYHALIDLEDPENEENYVNNILPFLRSIRSSLSDGGMLVLQDHSPNIKIVVHQVERAGFKSIAQYVENRAAAKEIPKNWQDNMVNWSTWTEGMDSHGKNYVLNFIPEDRTP